MKENEAKFLGEFFNLIGKYDISFGTTEGPTYIFMGEKTVATIDNNAADGTSYVTVEL